MLALSPTLQALAQAGPVELLPQGAGPEVGPGWVGAPAGAGTHVHICLQVSSNEGGRAHGIVGCWRTTMHCGVVEDPGWEDCNALWDAGGPRGGRAAIHCGILEGLGWAGRNALWDGGGPGVGGLQCIVGCWRAQGGRTALHCGVVEDLGWEDHTALWDGGGLQCIMGCWRSQVGVWCHYGILEGRRALWDVGGPRWGSHIIMGF